MKKFVRLKCKYLLRFLTLCIKFQMICFREILIIEWKPIGRHTEMG